MNELVMPLPEEMDVVLLTGPQDEFLHIIQDGFDAKIALRGNKIIASGEPAELEALTTLMSDLFRRIELDGELSEDDIHRSLHRLKSSEFAPAELQSEILHTYKGRVIRPKTMAQMRYVEAIYNNTITFGIGPAGTGKTYLAMAMAVDALNRKEVGRIILTRPVVEAGENLGFLPGTLNEKIDPYLRPLYDALFEMIDMHRAQKLLQEQTIEIAPLAFMRGRTLGDAYIILDEAQNTTPQQMKMFLTRLGESSKMVITGDVTQADLPHGISGLKTVRQVLEGIDGIAFCEFKSRDVVRNSLVAKIVSAYARAEERNLKL